MIKNPYKDLVYEMTMAEETIGGRPATITKEDGKIKIIFHPLAKDAKHPKANVFTVKLAKADLEKIKKAF
jgi:hypothetical protein